MAPHRRPRSWSRACFDSRLHACQDQQERGPCKKESRGSPWDDSRLQAGGPAPTARTGLSPRALFGLLLYSSRPRVDDALPRETADAELGLRERRRRRRRGRRWRRWRGRLGARVAVAEAAARAMAAEAMEAVAMAAVAMAVEVKVAEERVAEAGCTMQRAACSDAEAVKTQQGAYVRSTSATLVRSRGWTAREDAAARHAEHGREHLPQPRVGLDLGIVNLVHLCGGRANLPTSPHRLPTSPELLPTSPQSSEPR